MTSLRLLVVVLGMVASLSRANAFDELIPGHLHVVRPASLARMVAKPTGAFSLPEADPRIVGGSLSIVDDAGGGSPPMVVMLPSAGWVGKGRPPGSTGYRYKGAGTPDDPCVRVVVKKTAIQIICRGTGVTLVPPFAGDSVITLTIGSGTPSRYCARFGGTTIDNRTGLLYRTDAPPPTSCGVPITSTTSSSTSTSTSSTSSTSRSTTTSTTSSTSTTLVSTTSSTSTSTSSTSSTTTACCNGAAAVGFLTADASGDCGDIVPTFGPSTNLACNGLYMGGGGNSYPLPIGIPDGGRSVAAVTACNAQVATLGPTTALQSGSSKTCTAAGCLFGAPVAVPDFPTPPTSLCLVNRISGSIAGTLACNTGAVSLSLPVDSMAYLTGDTATDPAGTIPGIQPCPICSAGTCIGGTNNGMACVPANLVGGLSYPTSADCPPDPMYDVGTMAIGFALSTGTVTWTGTVATNDTGSTASIQNRVFSGYCRDTDNTGVFQSPHKHCWQNGMAVGSACSQPFETCEQSNNGAFGPNGGANRTITAVGAAFSGILSGPTAGTLVSLFSIPPTFQATTDAAIDLPGPGAVAIPMTARMCATVAGCP